MEYRENKNNDVKLCGTVRGGFSFSHEVFGEKFYEAIIETERLSGHVDIVPVIASERLFDASEEWGGRVIFVAGDMRSRNKWEAGKNRLFLHVFCKYFSELETFGDADNSIFLDGYICNPVNYRVTPTGREIADMMLAVNRAYGKSDYIPCICWGRNASFASGLNVGDHLRVNGRIQSREYKKRISEEEQICRTVYEVSISSMEVVSDAEAESC